MLLIYNQFLIRKAIRSPLYLPNPIVLTSDDVVLPRMSVVHYLDVSSNDKFPTRDMHYFNQIPSNKKIPVFHVNDLSSKDDVSVLENKFVNRDIRKWYQTNLKEFKRAEILDIATANNITPALVNYNLLKDMYRYRTSLLSRYHRDRNLLLTYYNGIKKSLQTDTSSINIVRIDLNTTIPAYNIVEMLLKFNIVKFNRVVSDMKLRFILDIYRWIDPVTRSNSLFKDITEEDSTRIVIELHYKNYISYLPLSIIVGMNETSSINSTVKYSVVKVKKIFIRSLLKVQDSIDSVLEGITDSSTDIDQQSDLIEVPDNEINSEDDIEVEDSIQISGITDSKSSIANQLTPTLSEKDIELDNLELDSKDLAVSNLNDLFSEKEDLTEVDMSFLKSIDTVEKSSVDVTEDSDESIFNVDYSEENITKLTEESSLDNKLEEYIKDATLIKSITSTEVRNLRKLRETRNTLTSPYSSELLDTYSAIENIDTSVSEDTIKLPIVNELVEDTFKENVIGSIDNNYKSKLLSKDIVASVRNIENAGIIIKDYIVDTVTSSTDNYEIHAVTIKPITGKESTVYFRIPRLDRDNEILASGIRYTIRKLKTDLPIRKISPIRVVLTSNYGKLFISRIEKKANSRDEFILSYIRKSYINDEGVVTKVIPGTKTLNTSKLPNDYYLLSSNFNEVSTRDITLLTNYSSVDNYIDTETKELLNKKNFIFIGYNKSKDVLAIDYSNIIHNVTTDTVVGTIESTLQVDRTKIPKYFSVLKVLGDDIPLGVCLGYYLGLNNLLAITNTRFTTIPANSRHTESDNELVLRFSDVKLIVTTDTEERKLLFNGYSYYKDHIKKYDVEEFNRQDIYLLVIESRGSSLIHIKELNTLRDIFLDPITKDVLESMKEPTEYIRLLLRSNELLKDYSHPDVNDPNYSRIRGYDRIPGLVYKALSESVREYKIKGRSKSKVELDPYKVWNYILQDSSKITEDTNPILDLKESELVTLTGIEGLSKDAVPLKQRKYHSNDIGLVSEATVDSSDVGTSFSLSPYTKINDLRGIVDRSSTKHVDEKSKIFSTSAQLAPLVEKDDPKRINFISIQNSHSIAAEGYHQPLLRTGYEYIVPYRAGSIYANMASKDGVVTELTSKLITVQYTDKSIETFKLNSFYGRMEGKIYPHPIVTDLKLNSKFSKGDPITYNSNFFERDWLDSSKLILKTSKTVSTALTLTDETYEDGSAISKELSEDMSTYVVKERIFVLEFDKELINILPEGSETDHNTLLFTIAENLGNTGNLSEDSLALLENLANTSPKAKYKGVLERYEVKYNGDIGNMSPSIKKLVTRLNKQIFDETKNTEYETTSNKVNSEYRSEGKNLSLDTLELKAFIRVRLSQGVGDKGVFASQMKSVIGDVFTTNIVTESGTKVDAIFSFISINNRVVISPLIMGTTNRLLKSASKKVADIYFNTKK